MLPIVYKGQTSFAIRIETELDLNDSSELKIQYRKPSGVEGEIAANVEGFFQDGILYYDLLPAGTPGALELDEVGTWDFWPYIKWSDLRVSIGDPAQLLVLYPGASL